VSLLKLAEITEEGVKFQSPIDGSEMLLTPEQSVSMCFVISVMVWPLCVYLDVVLCTLVLWMRVWVCVFAVDC
jgi:hypothetical protein